MVSTTEQQHEGGERAQVAPRAGQSGELGKTTERSMFGKAMRSPAMVGTIVACGIA